MVDLSKLNYFSGWDIDQLVATDTVPIGAAGEHAVYTTTESFPPEMEIQFRPSGFAHWFNAGTGSTNPSLGTDVVSYAYWSGNTLMVHTSGAGDVRYFVWADRITN